MKTVSQKELKATEAIVNRVLQRTGSNMRINVSGRYGYQGIDVYDIEGDMQKTLVAGLTKKEANNFLVAYLYIKELEDK